MTESLPSRLLSKLRALVLRAVLEGTPPQAAAPAEFCSMPERIVPPRGLPYWRVDPVTYASFWGQFVLVRSGNVQYTFYVDDAGHEPQCPACMKGDCVQRVQGFVGEKGFMIYHNRRGDLS